MNPLEYQMILDDLRRMEAECACELPALTDHSAASRAERLLDCDDPPRGDDRTLCVTIANARIL